ncbi:WXG100 family type VII secretion target [Streptomyces sp. DSM 41527]|uniref:WXG100 family type VII secretion target n=1 Tax=Streptomyces mooreae TaxID=3075523 RepID=A0ABU2T5N0_9ACTN|nr:WXG100 family type VII secretion target [Streptomyces sp. DSM 41527]MDT0455535.1 WXG100 family type VII secretion target [Streptomyces sp. DSM 41527]
MAENGQFSVHPEDMKSVAPTFGTQSAHLNEALGTLKHTLDGLGAPWGEDKQGKQFAHSYAPQRDAILEALGVLVKGLDSIHDGLTHHADNHAEGDRHAAGHFRR